MPLKEWLLVELAFLSPVSATKITLQILLLDIVLSPYRHLLFSKSPLVAHREANGETVLTGEVVDQAALYGLISKVRDLHLTLISVSPLEADSPSKEEAKEKSS